MSDYTVTTNFTALDALAPGHADKVITGTRYGTEFTNIATAIATKANTASPTFTGTVTVPTPFTVGAVSVTATGTELNYVDGVTSNVQTQLDAKAPLASPTFTTAVTLPATVTTELTASRALTTNGSSQLAASAVTATELGYVSGVTSALQTQLNLLAPKANPTFTGTLSAATGSFSAAVTATQFNVSSSRELKQDIRPVEAGALNRVLNWNISEYAYKTSPERQEIGLVAEDTDNRISSGKTINVNAAIFELAAAVQELARKVQH